MKNSKGQALIEFTLILPIIILLLLYIIEFGRITLKKQSLEGNMDLIVTLYKENKKDELTSYLRENNIDINYIKQDNLTTIQIEENINSNIPLINKILGNKINTKRTVYDPIEQ